MRAWPSTRIAGILLAAGSSTRFGGDKQLAMLDGVPMLRRAAALLADAGLREVIVVLRPGAGAHREALSGLPVRIVENADAASGMASSLAAGVRETHTAEAGLITVCDQPAVTATHLQTLIARWSANAAGIIASQYGDATGVPALFSASYFPALMALTGDRGAGQLLVQYRDHTVTVRLDDGGFDIDTADDIARYRRR